MIQEFIKTGDYTIFTDFLIMVAIKILGFVAILVIGFWIAKQLRKFLRKKMRWGIRDRTIAKFLHSAIDVVVKVFVIILAITYAGVATSSILAMVGAAGLAIGLALQGSLSNLAAGVLIISLRPIHVGDYIEASNFSGTVTEIGLFYTYLCTPDNKSVAVPNSQVTSTAITNYSIYSTRRMDFDFTVSYDADAAKVREILLSIAKSDAQIMQDPEPMAAMISHGDSAIGVKLRFWVKTVDFWEVHFKMHELVKREFDAAGIEIPFPQMVLHGSESIKNSKD